MHRCLVVVALFAVTGSIWAQSENAPLKLLQETAQRYADAKSYQIEKVTEYKAHSELSDSSNKVFTDAAVDGNGKYRFESRNETGSALAVSDGVSEWDLHRSYAEYVKRASGAVMQPLEVEDMLQQEDAFPLSAATSLHRGLMAIGFSLKSAHFLPDESISVNGKNVGCRVVTFTGDDYLKPQTDNSKETLWIDRQTGLLVKDVSESDSRAPMTSKGPAPGAVLTHHVNVTLYTLTRLNQTIDPELFHFTPPAGVAQVEKFSNPHATPTPTQLSSPANDAGPLPVSSLTMLKLDGSKFDIASLRGHPVLIDLWATWCVPCVSEIPFIARIAAKTKAAGLTVVGLDYSEDLVAGSMWLKEHGYLWNDYQGDMNARLAIPVVYLIDAQGNTVYTQTGVKHGDDLIKAIKALGPDYALALAGEAAPQEPVAR